MTDYPARKTLEDKEMFNDIVNALLSVVGEDVVKIILYGSVARGDNTWESDIDIAMLTTREYDWAESKRVYNQLWEYDLKYDTLFQIVLIGAYEFFEAKYDLPFYMNIEKEGVVLWKKCA